MFLLSNIVIFWENVQANLARKFFRMNPMSVKFVSFEINGVSESTIESLLKALTNGF